MKIKVEELEDLIRTSLSKKYSKEEIDLIIPILMFGELSGRSTHGILRAVTGEVAILARKPKGKPKRLRTSNVSEVIDGLGNPGMLVGNICCDDVIEVAKKEGIGIVGSRGSIGSCGSLSYYCEKIAKENLIGLIMARAPADIAPYGGLERLFGTNPIAFGIPTKTKPLIFDMATSGISYGAVLEAKAQGKELPEGVAIDNKGKITRDPDLSLQGAFLPFDRSYKGAGLAMMVEILAGILTGADFADMRIGDEWGNTFIAFKPELLSDIKEFKNRVSLFVERVRNSKTIDGFKVRISGESTIEKRDKAIRDGFVEVDGKLLKRLEEYIKTGKLK